MLVITTIIMGYKTSVNRYGESRIVKKLTFIISILVITFMQGIYNDIPKTNHVSRVYSDAAVLNLQFVLHVMLFCPLNMFCTFTLALSAVCVQWPVQLFFAVP